MLSQHNGENPASVAAHSKGLVGIVTNSFESVYYSMVMEAASNHLKSRGFGVVAQAKAAEASSERDAFAALVDSGCDGYIFQADVISDDEINALMQTHPTLVMLNRHMPLFPDRCVDINNIAGGELAAQYLVAQGHRRIAMVRGPEKIYSTHERALGFRRTLEQHDIKVELDLAGNFVEHGGEQAIKYLQTSNSDITAIFFQNDDMAFGALNACRQLGIKVPEDLSIIGFDGIPMCDYVTPRLTSVQQPMRQMGDLAAQIVADLLKGVHEDKRARGTTYLPVLGERESVALRAGHHPEKIALTQRETECLTWTANGKTSWEISVILGVSESTATFHLRNAATKLKASNRTHAAVKALHLGLIEFF